jgi:transcriptional regulator
MYVAEHFAVHDADALVLRLARNFAGVLLSVGADGQLLATHVPIVWDPATRCARGHIARANPHWKLGAGRSLIVLTGAQAYVSPRFYPSKAEHGKVVPTWNYEAVHLSGAIEWFADAARLEQLVRDLSRFHEGDGAQSWSVDDAPRPYIEAMLNGIVGVEMRVDKLEAKRKLSQNKSGEDFAGVIAGLEKNQGAAAEIAAQMRAERALGDDPDGN